MKYFKHDSNASMDAKLKKVRAKYGMEGYGVYWYCLELIAQNVEKHNLTFELEHDAEIISVDTNIHVEQIEMMMQDFIKWRLFENSNGIITCLKMLTRTDEYTQKLLNSVKKYPDNLPTLSRQSPDSLGRKSELIEENRIEEIYKGRFITPTIDEIKAYCSQRKNSINADYFFHFYESKNWMIGKNKMKNWKAAIITWELSSVAKSEKTEMDKAL